MAHADYDCCAICDSKMDYNAFESTTKEKICEECLAMLSGMGFYIETVEEFRKLIFEELKYKESKQLLMDLQYKFCFYNNDLDKDIFYRYFSDHKTFNYYEEKLKEKE